MNTEELVRLITQQVLQNFPGATACAGCSGGCAGMCAQQCPDDCRVVVSAGADRLSAPLGIRQIAPDLAAMIDHTLLKPDATADQVMQLCQEARQYQFASVCLNPSWVALAARELRGSNVPVCTVVGFPLGATMPEVKAFEAQRCIADGAREVDMVINIGALKSRDYRLVAHDISAVVQAAHSCNVLVKVIIETALLSDEEKVEACALAQAAGAAQAIGRCRQGNQCCSTPGIDHFTGIADDRSRRSDPSRVAVAFFAKTGSSSLQELQFLLLVLPGVRIRQRRLGPCDAGPVLGLLRVQRDQVVQAGGNVLLCLDRLDRTLRDADRAVDAFIGVDDEHVRTFPEAIHRTDVHAVGVLAANAGFKDDVRHGDRQVGQRSGHFTREWPTAS